MASETEKLHYIPGIGQWHDRIYADKDLFIPVLTDSISPGTIDPPFDNSKPAIGSFNGIQYKWNEVTQEWIESGGSGTGDTLSDTHTVLGDGTTSTFTWLHGLGFDPSSTGFTIDPRTLPAQGIFQKSANATHFTVSYDVCPIGTLIFTTTAKIV